MEQAKYAAWHVHEIYPSLRKGTLHTWIKAGIINPAIPPKGQGFPARYSGENLVEIGIVLQLARLGFDSHESLCKRLVQSPTSANRPLIRYIHDVHKFQCFLILPGASAFGQELSAEDKDAGPLHFLRPLDKLVEFFGAHLPTGGWVVIDVGFIKETVEIKLANL